MVPVLKQKALANNPPGSQFADALRQLKLWMNAGQVVGGGHWCADYVLAGSSPYEVDVANVFAVGEWLALQHTQASQKGLRDPL